MNDRLKELIDQTQVNQQDRKEEAKKDIILTIEEETLFEKIKSTISLVDKSILLLSSYLKEYKKTCQENKKQEIITKVSLLKGNTISLIQLGKKQFQEIKQSKSKKEITLNLIYFHLHQFQKTVTRFQEASFAFDQQVKQSQERLLKQIRSNLTEDEIKNIIEEKKVKEVIQQVLLQDSNHPLRYTVDQIENRHVEILNLEREILELHQLFKDLSTLVDLHQESLDHIEEHINKSKNHVEYGEVNLQDAETYQKKGRKRQCCLLLICVSILLVILLPLLLTKRF